MRAKLLQRGVARATFAGGRGAAAEGRGAGKRPAKKIDPEQAADISPLTDPQRGKEKPGARRSEAQNLQGRSEVSEPRAYPRVVEQHRSTQRYQRLEAERELELV